MDLGDRVAIVTGASMGLGKKICELMLQAGATVVMCARNEDALSEAERELRQYIQEGQDILTVPCDVSVEKDVAHVVEMCTDRFGEVDILVNNAGIHGAKGELDLVDLDEWKSAIEVNLYGPVHMMRAVVPYMKKNGYGKIINIAGGGATGPRPYFSAYAAAKSAIVRLTETLAKEWKQYSIDINAVSPGAMNTRLLDDILSAGERIGEEYNSALKRKENGGTPPEVGAELCVFLASEESDGISGRVISAVWDNWKDLTIHKEELEKSDIYTLRRIISKDRGMNWEK